MFSHELASRNQAITVFTACSKWSTWLWRALGKPQAQLSPVWSAFSDIVDFVRYSISKTRVTCSSMWEIQLRMCRKMPDGSWLRHALTISDSKLNFVKKKTNIPEIFPKNFKWKINRKNAIKTVLRGLRKKDRHDVFRDVAGSLWPITGKNSRYFGRVFFRVFNPWWKSYQLLVPLNFAKNGWAKRS